jgi:hypothetical protein
MNQYTGAKVKVAPEVEREIVRDYCTPGLPLATIKAKYGVTDWTLNVIRLKWGLRRYQTNASPAHPTLRRAMDRRAAPWDEGDGPEVKLRRCPICSGTEDLAAPHQHGAAA